MHYFEVLVAGGQYHGQAALTYGSFEVLSPGAIVQVPLRSDQTLGIVRKEVKKPAFQAKSVSKVFKLPPLRSQTLELITWLAAYYPAPLGTVTQLFLPKLLSEKRLLNRSAGLVTHNNNAHRQQLPALTAEQKSAIESMSGPGTFLLHGETGSGKTRVYGELVERALKNGRSAIILTPEVGLTSQLAVFFRSLFGEKVIIMHSQLADAERRRAWISMAESKEPLVVIGARSALFSPLTQIGLIVVDEAHEGAYKQEQAPHYQATRVAAKLGQLHTSTVIFGSATPPVVEYFLAEQKNRPIIRMQQLALADAEHKTHITVVDLKDRTTFSGTPYLSKPLLTAIDATLAKHEQVLLFLNRRGTARIVFCEQCSWQATCPTCDLPLVYHGDNHTMRCHTCGFRQTTVSTCPTCGNPSIIFKTVGTKAITAEIEALFPAARVKRFDTDNRRAERIEQQYGAVRDGQVDIIVGTQTLAKGLDLPNLGLVGVILADTSLYLPDFTSQERTYQLLAQVLGRIGRGHRDSRAIVQTYNPDSPLLRAILAKDWGAFYNRELAERQKFLFPPFCYILKVSCRRTTSNAAQNAAEALAQQLRSGPERILVEGPAPSFHEKLGGKYQWQLIIKARNRSTLTNLIAKLPSGWSYDIDPTNLL